MATWTINVIASTGYFGIVFLMFVENVFPPIPSEVIMPLAGYMATRGELALAGVIVAGTAGSVLGALPLYWLGRVLGEERVKGFADRHGRWLTVSRRDLERARRWFDRYGARAVLLCRMVPGIRSLISVPAGIVRMGLGRFLVYTTLGASVWTAALAGLGYWLGSSYQRVGEYLDPVSWLVLGAIVVVYVVRVARHRRADD